ncbi:hypothetical protein R3P38DRAFT_2768673 [Favolaschia claudopus]|uniref:Uncharacterized protein n=1 Tax=Favolaschia claudopus TaxID=2862362 RepID=A0AAW0CRE9_9AGAR
MCTDVTITSHYVHLLPFHHYLSPLCSVYHSVGLGDYSGRLFALFDTASLSKITKICLFSFARSKSSIHGFRVTRASNILSQDLDTSPGRRKHRTNLGTQRWISILAQEGGNTRWISILAQEGGNTRWISILAQEGGNTRWISILAQEGGNTVHNAVDSLHPLNYLQSDQNMTRIIHTFASYRRPSLDPRYCFCTDLNVNFRSA